jgi:hypothetical protein
MSLKITFLTVVPSSSVSGFYIHRVSISSPGTEIYYTEVLFFLSPLAVFLTWFIYINIETC